MREMDEFDTAIKMAQGARQARNRDAEQALAAFCFDMANGEDPEIQARILYHRLGGKVPVQEVVQ